MKQRFSVVRFLVYLVGFTSLLLLRLVVSPDGQGGIAAFVACVAAIAAGYMVYYASSEGYSRNLMSGVLVYLALAAVVAACPPFVLVLAFLSITGLVKRRRALLVQAMSSIALFVLIFPMPLAHSIGMPELAGAPAGIAYIGLALGWSAWASRSPLKLGLFKFATMLLAVPLTASFVALVGGGMFSRPERRVRNSMTRARKALTLALPAPAPEVAVPVPRAVVAGTAAEMLAALPE
ncbi:hypothetical protein AWB76_06848 [Caballeronia temeraria]|uniref:Uncharacterized protein n=1 Tax=Caballeronia temeraria TaxID=1777137 RepID=A0A158DE68_9BURK|nr:hypothetical protein [Caballeronia temeraria]SAK92763.1 hypothetical protein AWB76_06848 [Caballeronia temeraria]